MADPREIPGRCNRPTRQGEGLCKRGAGAGTSHVGSGPCKLHGGSIPNVARHHEQLLAQQDVEKAVTRLGLTRAEAEGDHQRLDPREILSLELLRSHRVVTALEALVQGLEENELHGPLYHADGGTTGRALPHVLVTMFQDERRHLVAVAAAAARAGIEERRVQLEQEKGQLIADVIRKTIDAIDGLTAPQRQQAMVGAATALRALPSAA